MSENSYVQFNEYVQQLNINITNSNVNNLNIDQYIDTDINNNIDSPNNNNTDNT